MGSLGMSVKRRQGGEGGHLGWRDADAMNGLKIVKESD